MATIAARLVKPGKKLHYVVLPSKEVKYIKEKNGTYILEPKKGLTLNNQAVTVDRSLTDGDEIKLVESFLGIKNITEWVFQADPVLAKKKRVEAERERGIMPTLPEKSSGSGDFDWTPQDFTADEDKITTGDIEIPWAELERVLFWKTKKGYSSRGAIGATVGALRTAAALAEEAGGASEYEVAFRDGIWRVQFFSKDKGNVAIIEEVEPSDCLIIAKTVDYYSPADSIQVFSQMAT